MPIWNPPVETMPRAELEQLQLERLQAVVNRIWESVPFYRRRFEELGLMPEHLRSLDDLRLLPFTLKEDLRSGYPYDLFAVPLREVAQNSRLLGDNRPCDRRGIHEERRPALARAGGARPLRRRDDEG